MTLQQQIWRAKNADLIHDQASYRRAIEANEFPDMIPLWRETVDRIEHEIEQRNLLASTVTSWTPTLINEVPF